MCGDALAWGAPVRRPGGFCKAAAQALCLPAELAAAFDQLVQRAQALIPDAAGDGLPVYGRGTGELLRQRDLPMQSLQGLCRRRAQGLRQQRTILLQPGQHCLQRRQLLGETLCVELEQCRVANAAPCVPGHRAYLGHRLAQRFANLLA